MKNEFYWAVLLIISVGIITSLLLITGRTFKELLWDNQRLNSGNLVARYGGDEFVIILPDSTTEAAVSIGEKTRAVVGCQKVFKTDEYPNLKVTISLGVATFPDHIHNMRRMVGELIDIADENLYSAKKRGETGYVISMSLLKDED